jgi:acyl-CoA thioester hydrolase
MLSPYHFYHTLRVRYSEIDGQKVVFNSHYLTYLDVAVVEYFRNIIGNGWMELAEDHTFDIALVKTTLEFKKTARLDQVLRVYCRISKLGNSSFTVMFAILPEDEDGTVRETDTILTAEAVYVNYHSALQKSQPIPSEVRSKIMEFENEEELM